jgi:BTB/POZ domain-containing protein KCTD8/12/16
LQLNNFCVKMQRSILDYLRDGQTPSLSYAEKERLRVEATFFGLPFETPRANVARGSICGDRAKACITLGYRGTFAFGKDGLIDVKFRKLSRILVAGRLSACREVFMDTLNESRDPDHGDAESRYSSRLYLKHSCLEQAFDMLYENGFRLVTSCGTGTSGALGETKAGVDSEESKWQHYNEFIFVRE